MIKWPSEGKTKRCQGVEEAGDTPLPLPHPHRPWDWAATALERPLQHLLFVFNCCSHSLEPHWHVPGPIRVGVLTTGLWTESPFNYKKGSKNSTFSDSSVFPPEDSLTSLFLTCYSARLKPRPVIAACLRPPLFPIPRDVFVGTGTGRLESSLLEKDWRLPGIFTK